MARQTKRSARSVSRAASQTSDDAERGAGGERDPGQEQDASLRRGAARRAGSTSRGRLRRGVALRRACRRSRRPARARARASTRSGGGRRLGRGGCCSRRGRRTPSRRASGSGRGSPAPSRRKRQRSAITATFTRTSPSVPSIVQPGRSMIWPPGLAEVDLPQEEHEEGGGRGRADQDPGQVPPPAHAIAKYPRQGRTGRMEPCRAGDRRGRRFSGRREVAIGLGAYALYLGVRALVVNERGRRRARRNAERIVAVERRLGIHVEPALQRLLLPRTRLVAGLNVGYAVPELRADRRLAHAALLPAPPRVPSPAPGGR